MVKRKLNIKLVTSGGDAKGRLCYAIVLLNGTKFGVPPVYAPNVFCPAFFESVKYELLDFADSIHIVGGGFDSLSDPLLDTTNPDTSTRKTASSYLNSFLHELNTVDVWHLQNPNTKDYTLYFLPLFFRPSLIL